ncbi:MAG: asparagine synthase (glutamine-hydrolyzing) [Rhodobacter sp.]|jgi:asparagine synthase (glutamine-hydrolysing)|nr:asparagine synthase (glutamine-hydrolyzing) [Rhodobacter sp.]
MCGIVGFIGRGGPKSERIAAVRAGIRAILHRGPEEVGYYDDDVVTLGAVRLSVLDPALGKQPMMTADGRYILGFNGEIFNYIELRQELESRGVVFQTKSDTEVLLNSLAYWGVEGALPRLNGQFGFAFYDRAAGALVLGRDPFGEKPVFYASHRRNFYFASEVKGLFAFPEVPRALSPGRVLSAARFWSPIPDETAFVGVRALPPGSIARIGRDGRPRVSKYYRGLDAPAVGLADVGMTFEEACEELRAHLRDAVRLRLRADYPVGASVSGGVDSAIVSNIVRQEGAESPRTFSIRPEQARFDEGPHQDAVVSELGGVHSTVHVSAREIRQRFPEVVEHCEMPIHRAAPVACSLLAEHVGQAGVRVLIGGEGADEQFLGYDIAKEAAALAARSIDDAGARLTAAINDTLHTTAISGDQILQFHRNARPGASDLFGAHFRRFEAEPLGWLPEVAGDALVADRRLEEWALGQAHDLHTWDPVRRTQWLDIHTFFIGYAMPCHGDRAGARFNVESRYPFLDPNVTAFAARLPREWKLKDGAREKHILREAFSAELPRAIADRPKFGMRIPGAAALRPTKADDWISHLLSPDNLARSSIVDPTGVRELVARVTAYPGEVPHPDSHAYLHVLSSLLLEDRLVRTYRPPAVDIDSILVKAIDGCAAPLQAA